MQEPDFSNPGPVTPNMLGPKIHIRNPNKGPRLLNQVPTVVRLVMKILLHVSRGLGTHRRRAVVERYSKRLRV